MNEKTADDSASTGAGDPCQGPDQQRRANVIALASLFLCSMAPLSTHAAEPPVARVKDMKIRINLEGTQLTATLEHNEAARDFAAMLPMTLTLKDYAATEKVSDLPKKLSTQGAPPGFKPSVGDIAYYAPWGNLAFFYKDFGYSSGLVKLGTIDGSPEALQRPGPLQARVELIQQ